MLLVVEQYSLDCRSVGRVSSASRQVSSFCDAELGFRLVQ